MDRVRQFIRTDRYNAGSVRREIREVFSQLNELLAASTSEISSVEDDYDIAFFSEVGEFYGSAGGRRQVK